MMGILVSRGNVDTGHRGKTKCRQGDGGHLPAKERGFSSNPSCPRLDPRLPTSRAVRKSMSAVEAIQVCGTLSRSPGRLTQTLVSQGGISPRWKVTFFRG